MLPHIWTSSLPSVTPFKRAPFLLYLAIQRFPSSSHTCTGLVETLPRSQGASNQGHVRVAVDWNTNREPPGSGTSSPMISAFNSLSLSKHAATPFLCPLTHLSPVSMRLIDVPPSTAQLQGLKTTLATQAACYHGNTITLFLALPHSLQAGVHEAHGRTAHHEPGEMELQVGEGGGQGPTQQRDDASDDAHHPLTQTATAVALH